MTPELYLIFVDILWYHNSKFIRSNENIKIDINFDLMTTTCTILQVSKDLVGSYQCKAINDVSEECTKAKVELTSSSGVSNTKKEEIIAIVEPPKFKPKLKPKRHAKTVAEKLEKEKIIVSAVKLTNDSHESEVDVRTDNSTSSVQVVTTHHLVEEDNVEILVETEEIHVKIYKEAFSQEEIENFKIADEVNVILDSIKADQFGCGELPLRELATIGYLLKKGVSVFEITQLYNANFFPALKMPESQSALVQLVERQGHENLIAEVLSTETVEDEAMLASTVGFRAFMRMVEVTEKTVEEVLANFKFEDFCAQEWKHKEIKDDEYIEITESRMNSIRSETITGNEE